MDAFTRTFPLFLIKKEVDFRYFYLPLGKIKASIGFGTLGQPQLWYGAW